MMDNISLQYAATLGDVVRYNAAQYGDRVAFHDAAGATTFTQFAERVAALQRAFGVLGLLPGDRVAFLSRNRTEYVELYAASDCGVISVPLNWRLGAEQIAQLLQDATPSLLVVEESFVERLEAVAALLPSIAHKVILGATRTGWLNYAELIKLGSADSAQVITGQVINRAAANDPACIVYTSGTTGIPKGAMLTHRGLLNNSRAAIQVTHLNADEVTLSVMPLFHVGGMWYHLFPSFAAGALTIIQPSFSPENVLKTIEHHGVTNVHLVPTMVSDLIAQPYDETSSSTLRTVFYAASPMPTELLRRALVRFAGCNFVQGYGSTEGGWITCLTTQDHRDIDTQLLSEQLLRSCGRPVSGVELRLLDANGNEVAAGEVGELAVRSDKTMLAYWDKPAASAAVFQEGWLLTGDLGWRDAQGYFFIVDRKNDMIISGGENIYPTEIEQVLYEMPNVAEAAVVGLPDPRWVERVVACVAPRAGATLTEQEVLAHLSARLLGYKRPKQVFVLDVLPKVGVGKISRKELRVHLVAVTGAKT